MSDLNTIFDKLYSLRVDKINFLLKKGCQACKSLRVSLLTF